MDESPGILVPALIGGSIMAVLSWIPVISMGNCLCCMWLLLGGGTAVYLYRRQLSPSSRLTEKAGARVGLLAGLFGALFFSLLTYLMIALTGMNPGQGLIEAILNSSEEIPAEIESWLLSFQDEGISPFFVVLGLIFNLGIYSLFGLLGGILGEAILSRRDRRQIGANP